jgi:molecular chaperone Hsp33
MDKQEDFTSNISLPDTLAHGFAADGTVRCLAAVTTNTVAEAAQRHKTYKEFDRLTVQIAGNGIIEGIIAEANSQGGVRGYVKNPNADVPLNANGKFDVRTIVGEGMFYVTREAGFDIGLHKDPYRGSVPIVSGEIAEDFAYYLLKSEQIPSAVLLGVLLNPYKHQVLASGGVIIQMMPGADENTISEIERAISQSPATTTLISEGARPADLLQGALGAIDFEILEEKPIGFSCNCSYDRAISLVSSIERNELETMLREDKGAVMICHFCNNEYRLDESELEKILQERT